MSPALSGWEALFFPFLLCMETSRHSAENKGETGPGAFGKPHWDLFQGIHQGKALRDNGDDGQLEKSETYICL